MMRTAAVVVSASLALAGCSSVREAKISESFQMNYDEVVPVRETAPDGAIYSRANAGFFLGDRRAQRVGDLLTVKLDESMTATKKDDTSLNRSGNISATLPSALFGPGAINISPARPNGLSTSTSSDFSGAAQANKTDTVKFDITVVVTRVYENGNLWVE
jgi:flagellar L-ring protein precursor FlgH